MSEENIEKLEIVSELSRRFPDWINPEIESIKLCRNEKVIFLEIIFYKKSGMSKIISNLDFIGDDDDLNKILFSPEKEITDNAIEFVSLDAFTISMCEEKIFKNEVMAIINKGAIRGS